MDSTIELIKRLRDALDTTAYIVAALHGPGTVGEFVKVLEEADDYLAKRGVPRKEN